MNEAKHTKKEERAHKRAVKVQRDRLNKAAPSLLAALIGVLPVFWNDHGDIGVLRKVYQDRIEAAEAAIAKAEGRS
jgi:hypothetical protein